MRNAWVWNHYYLWWSHNTNFIHQTLSLLLEWAGYWSGWPSSGWQTTTAYKHSFFPSVLTSFIRKNIFEIIREPVLEFFPSPPSQLNKQWQVCLRFKEIPIQKMALIVCLYLLYPRKLLVSARNALTAGKMFLFQWTFKRGRINNDHIILGNHHRVFNRLCAISKFSYVL